jgi:hypothetical protein
MLFAIAGLRTGFINTLNRLDIEKSAWKGYHRQVLGN